ncbi:transposase [Candidatus Poribacteria bacterium]|nr:transposase [Candidatus Poribacteria bacterium]
MNSILWILRTRAPWSDLPEKHPTYQTCHRRSRRLLQLR